MSNLMLLNPSAVPAHIAALAGQASPMWVDPIELTNSIRTKGGKFQAVMNGEPVGAKQNHLDIIIVGDAPKGRGVARAWYAEKYTDGSDASPSCSSDDGLTPRRDSPSPQSAKCEGCAHNVSSASVGGAATVCGYKKNLAVIVPAVGNELWRVTLSAKGIFTKVKAGGQEMWAGYNAYKTLLAKNSLSPELVVTRMEFPDGSVEGMRFQFVGYTPQETAQTYRDIALGNEVAAFLAPYPDKAVANVPSTVVPSTVVPSTVVPATTVPTTAVPTAPLYTPPVAVAPVAVAPVATVAVAPVAVAPVVMVPAPVFAAPAPVTMAPDTVTPAPNQTAAQVAKARVEAMMAGIQ